MTNGQQAEEDAKLRELARQLGDAVYAASAPIFHKAISLGLMKGDSHKLAQSAAQVATDRFNKRAGV